MKTLNDYLNKYYEIADNLGYSGASVEILVQLLANATYISECEHATYMEEASIEKAQLENSKIQHCMDMMYSVYRGSAPRVYMKVKSSKAIELVPYETDLVVSQNLKIHYLGYWNETKWEEVTRPVYADEDLIIEGFLTPKEDLKPEEATQVTSKNTYYVSYPEYSNLCDLVYVKIGGKAKPVTRIFSDHILHTDKIFDLTTTGFGSRLYIANFLGDINSSNTNLKVEPTFYQYSEISDYNENELERISIKGMDFVAFNEDNTEFLTLNHLNIDEPFKDGVYLIPAIPRTEINTIHYQAVKDRFANSLLRSNSDLSGLLYAEYPNKIVESGTTYKFVDNSETVNLYYIPTNDALTDEEIEKFKKNFSSYYIDKAIGDIEEGAEVDVKINMVLYLYNSSNTTELQNSINNIMSTFNKKFDVTLDKDEIISLIEKISDVKKVSSLDIEYSTDPSTLDKPCYFNITSNITTLV